MSSRFVPASPAGPSGSWLALIATVAVGGALGSALRHGLLAALVGRAALATWIANVLGCVVLGLVVGARERVALDERLQVFVGPGFCGGLTTVSGFTLQTTILARGVEPSSAAIYVLGSVIAGLAGGALGVVAARRAVTAPVGAA